MERLREHQIVKVCHHHHHHHHLIIGVGVERPRGVGKGPDFKLMVVVVVVVVAVVVAWPVERSGAVPKIRAVLHNEAPPLPFSDLLSSPFFPISQGSQLQHVKRLRGDSNPGHS